MKELKTLSIPLTGGEWANFTAQIKERRLELGLSLAQVAGNAGVVENTIRKFESNKATNINVCALGGIAKALKIKFVLDPLCDESR